MSTVATSTVIVAGPIGAETATIAAAVIVTGAVGVIVETTGTTDLKWCGEDRVCGEAQPQHVPTRRGRASPRPRSISCVVSWFTFRRLSFFLNSPCPPAATLIWKLASIVERIELAAMFPRLQPLEVELGSGDGSFLAEYAALHPKCNFIGVERLLGRLRKLDRKGRRAGLTNLRGVRIESAYFLQYLLPQHSVQALHIYFPDPWPKRKHRPRRLIGEKFPGLASQALAPGGTVYLRTDDSDYFDQMTSVFAASDAFCPAQTPDELSRLLTDFEKDFQARGVRTLRTAYRCAGPQ
jgi:tRNA (guanine-N7-)-methyltransferase